MFSFVVVIIINIRNVSIKICDSTHTNKLSYVKKKKRYHSNYQVNM